jgi:hypothetical protein
MRGGEGRYAGVQASETMIRRALSNAVLTFSLSVHIVVMVESAARECQSDRGPGESRRLARVVERTGFGRGGVPGAAGAGRHCFLHPSYSLLFIQKQQSYSYWYAMLQSELLGGGAELRSPNIALLVL